MTKCLKWQLLFIVIFFVPWNATAAVNVVDGTGRGFWDSKAIVVFQIVDINTPATAPTTLTVKILAVAATDVLTPTEMVITYSGRDSAFIHAEDGFSRGAVFLACIQSFKNQWILPPSGMLFMPSGCAVWNIKDLQDPRLPDALTKILQVRKKAEEKNDSG